MTRRKMSRSPNPRGLFRPFLLTLGATTLLLIASSGWPQDAYRIESYRYNPVGKVDPFKPLVKTESVKKQASSAPLTPLQQYHIAELKLVGIAGTGKKRMAMIVDKKGRSYIVSQGTPIGQNNGKVAQILEDRIVIEEKVLESKKLRINRLKLKLHRYEETQ